MDLKRLSLINKSSHYPVVNISFKMYLELNQSFNESFANPTIMTPKEANTAMGVMFFYILFGVPANICLMVYLISRWRKTNVNELQFMHIAITDICFIITR